jgi:GNAT superfamily N-acetyltransferase
MAEERQTPSSNPWWLPNPYELTNLAILKSTPGTAGAPAELGRYAIIEKEGRNVPLTTAQYFAEIFSPEAGFATISPDGLTLWLAQLQDNRQRGILPTLVLVAAINFEPLEVNTETGLASTALNIVGVDPLLRGRGYGCLLLKQGETILKEEARQKGADRLQILVQSIFPDFQDDRAAQFYNSMGYTLKSFLVGNLNYYKRFLNLQQLPPNPEILRQVVWRPTLMEEATCITQSYRYRKAHKDDEHALEIEYFLSGRGELSKVSPDQQARFLRDRQQLVNAYRRARAERSNPVQQEEETKQEETRRFNSRKRSRRAL